MTDPTRPVVAARSLRHEFGDTVALDSVTFTVEPGAVFALVGPNGAGKTTLLRILTALLEPTGGTAEVDGIDIRERPREVHSRLGFLPDFFGLYPDLTCREYLEYFHLAYRLPTSGMRVRVDEVLWEVGLTARAEAAVETLSRGMRQKLGLARVLLHDPPLLLLDEPAAGLDPGARQDMQGLLCSLAKRGKTIVVSSHILAELEDYCSHLAILDRGRMLYCGSLADARASLGRGRTFRLRVLSGQDAAAGILTASSKTRLTRREGLELDFEFEGDDAGAAALLRALVDAGVPVASFGEAAGTIQDSYLAFMEKRP